VSSERALLVEDDDSWREILGELLEDSGFEVSLATTLDDAQRQIRERSHRVAVVDLSLGGADHRNQDGLRVLETIKACDPNCQAILLTGYATVELAVSVITEEQATTCLRKESFSRAQFKKLLQKTSLAAPRLADTSATMTKPYTRGRALIAEDDAGWRELLSELLEEIGLACVTCGSFAEARGYLEREEWQLVVVDLQLSSSVSRVNQDGLRLLEVAKETKIPVLVVSGTGSAVVIDQIYRDQQIYGFFEKNSFHRSAFLELVDECLAPSLLDALTEREREVLDLLAEGLTNQQIAERLFISANTVKRHLKSVFEKLEVSNRAAAAALVTRRGSGAG
jgi:DNA-binding NarL/FixJ family response regulator